MEQNKYTNLAICAFPNLLHLLILVHFNDSTNDATGSQGSKSSVKI